MSVAVGSCSRLREGWLVDGMYACYLQEAVSGWYEPLDQNERWLLAALLFESKRCGD